MCPLRAAAASQLTFQSFYVFLCKVETTQLAQSSTLAQQKTDKKVALTL
ncbi:rCG49086 [Rattus norvegicus]|uniref:RCG49086 n=1 Tax=Rattus norvegicus TaxID=10116 RepID=A6IFF9_RAT|nr:rCG49086 [Rattus norvegicus]